jgi:hypothetical protein
MAIRGAGGRVAARTAVKGAAEGDNRSEASECSVIGFLRTVSPSDGQGMTEAVSKLRASNVRPIAPHQVIDNEGFSGLSYGMVGNGARGRRLVRKPTIPVAGNPAGNALPRRKRRTSSPLDELYRAGDPAVGIGHHLDDRRAFEKGSILYLPPYSRT